MQTYYNIKQQNCNFGNPAGSLVDIVDILVYRLIIPRKCVLFSLWISERNQKDPREISTDHFVETVDNYFRSRLSPMV